MFSIIFSILTFTTICLAQTNPQAWARGNRQSQEPIPQEISVNTDRLIRAIESRVSNIVRKENSEIRKLLEKLGEDTLRIENGLNSLKNDVKFIQDNIQGEGRADESSIFPANDNKLEPFMSTVSNTIINIEKDMKSLRRSLNRQLNNGKVNVQHHYAIAQDLPKRFFDSQTCSPNDHNQESGYRQIKQDFYAYCEMKVDGGSWTVIHTRYDGSVNFYRSWYDYKEGFGNLGGEFWLGLEKIHELTSNKLHELRIEMQNFEGVKTVAKYSLFHIGDEASGYSLKMLGAFSGDAGDSLSYHAGMRFSTHDVDNDEWSDGICARSHYGGWWYKDCDESNLNGKYFENETMTTDDESKGMYWKTFGGSGSSLQVVRMMIRPIEE